MIRNTTLQHSPRGGEPRIGGSKKTKAAWDVYLAGPNGWQLVRAKAHAVNVYPSSGQHALKGAEME